MSVLSLSAEDFVSIRPRDHESYYHGAETAEDLTVYEGGAVSNYAGGSNLLYIPSDIYYTMKALFDGAKHGENEETLDATMRLIGIPMNVISASGTIVGYGVGFGIIPKTPWFIDPITMITGLILCIVEGLVDVVSLNRQERFEKKFDFELLTHLRNMVDYRDRKTTYKAIEGMNRVIKNRPQLLDHLYGKEQAQLVKDLMEEITQEVMAQPHLLPSIMDYYRPAIEEISRQALIPNLRNLRDEYLHVHTNEMSAIKRKLVDKGLKGKELEAAKIQELERYSINKKKKLARRIRPWMVDEANQTIDPLLKGIVKNESEAIRQGLRLADDIHAQSQKKKIVHILGIVALSFAALSLIALAIAMPVTIPYILAGVAMTLALVRAGVFSGALDSRGWTFEGQKMLPEFIRKKIFKNTPRYPEITHQYKKASTPTGRRYRDKHLYSQKLDLTKQGFEKHQGVKISEPLQLHGLYV